MTTIATAPRRHADGALDIGFYRRRAQRAGKVARARFLRAALRLVTGRR